MKVKELLAQLAQVDQDLEVALVYLVYDVLEHWGELYHIADEVQVTSVQIDGPKRNGTVCLLIK